MFYNQPLSTRFGTDFISHISSGTWNSIDIAVAWIRASGIAHLAPALTAFLKAGGKLSVVVGIDFDNTTKEGLENLLALNKHGDVSVFVHHNEAGTIFHPKLYLFRNATHAKLIVGSNNITEAGLYSNTEAGLEITTNAGDLIIASVIDALDSWRDTSIGLAHQLDSKFLADLVSNGYVMDEAHVKAKMAKSRTASGTTAGAKKKLFGSLPFTAPSKPASVGTTSPAASPSKKKSAATPSAATSTGHTTGAPTTGQVLLMRVRKARGTQVQIPLAVLKDPFFTGVNQVFSVAGAIIRRIHPTHAARAKGGNPNTLKLEMPETSSMNDPIARFERTAIGVQYEVYDALSPQGRAIMQKLAAGRTTVPPTTHLTLPSNPSSSTWWRFI